MEDYTWYRCRGYLHFDPPISKNTAAKLVQNELKVSSHSFYPFISYEAVSTKFGFDTDYGILKKKDKLRPIAYASHLDSHIYAFYASKLNSLYEKKLSNLSLEKSVLAFRSIDKKSNIHFANDAFNEIKFRGECTALAFDITGFFDNLDHNLLKSAWCKLLEKETLPPDHFNVFKSITRFSKVDKVALFEKLGISENNPKVDDKRICSPKVFRDTVRKSGLIETNRSKGIPQGSPISALLSNIYMLDFDRAVVDELSKIEAPYYRYCDDILIICKPEKANDVRILIEDTIEFFKLKIQSKKTEVRTFVFDGKRLRANKPLQYLGFLFDGNNTYIRSSSISRYYKKARKGVWAAHNSMTRTNEIRQQKGLPELKLFRRTLNKRYTCTGRRNFLSYGYRAAKIMNSDSIRRQLKPHRQRIDLMIEKEAQSMKEKKKLLKALHALAFSRT